MKKLFALFAHQSLYRYLLLLVIVALLTSFFALFLENKALSSQILQGALIIGGIVIWYTLLRELTKGAFGVDVIAGVALIGTYSTGEYLAGVVVLLMISGGQLFEEYASLRAKKELTLLLTRTPEYAHVQQGTTVVSMLLSNITKGMHVIINPGEIVTVDGTVIDGEALVDESMLTGETIPVEKRVGSNVFAGTENYNGSIVVCVEKEASDSRYQAIIRLVKEAELSKAPLVRLADTYSLYFTGITFVIALFAWLISYDITRVVAVLVVATPCPLLLATPIAIIGGMSKASKKGVIIKNGGALEMLARVSTFVFDKTGTLTIGTPSVSKIIPFGTNRPKKIATIAASLEQLSSHIFARALLLYAHQEKLELHYPEKSKEHFGDGVEGTILKKEYYLGKKEFIIKHLPNEEKAITEMSARAQKEANVIVFLATKKALIGAITFSDTIRHDAKSLFSKLKRDGIAHLALLTGDKKTEAEAVGLSLGMTEVKSNCLPEDKMRFIKKLQKKNEIVAMVGDGINDAPALSLANVGIALGTHGKTSASESADIVILASSITKVHDTLYIAKKTITLAKQGISLGIGASTVAMVFGALGYIPPLTGVILQEVIDVVVILNALSLNRLLKK